MRCGSRCKPPTRSAAPPPPPASAVVHKSAAEGHAQHIFPLYGSSLRVMPRNPILLCHGLLGIAGIFGPNYFRGVRERFSMLGFNEVYATKVSRLGGLLVRAGELGLEIERYRNHIIQSRAAPFAAQHESFKFNIIGHSMGGLDARYYVAALGGAKNVASITTIGTPHHGSHVADLAIKLSEMARLESFFKFANMPMEGYKNITKAAMLKFNLSMPDHPDVHGEHTLRIHPLYITHKLVSSQDGPNDGLVAVEHQKWGEVIRVLPANHLEEINWYLHPNARFNALSDLYVDILRLLGEKGL